MELILISSPVSIPDEASRLNDYFGQGLKRFHLRKPYYSKEKLENFLQEVDPQYYPNIVLHSNHTLGGKFGFNRFHYPEDVRLITTEEELAGKVVKGNVLSTSVHSFDALKKLSPLFSYAFIGPVFPSISKKGYGDPFDPDKWSKIKNNTHTAVAIGGINSRNIQKINKLGFQGAALLGTIWSQPHKCALEELTNCIHHIQ